MAEKKHHSFGKVDETSKVTTHVLSTTEQEAEKRQHGSENVEEAVEARTRARSTTEQEPETSIHDSANIEEVSALSKTENAPDKRHHGSGKITEAEDVGTNECSTTEHEAVNRPHGTENMKEVDEARMHAEKKPHDSTNIKEAEDDRTHVLSTAEHEAEKGHHDSKNIEEAEEVRTHERFTTEHGAEMRPQGSTKIEEAEEDRKHVRSTAEHEAETHVPSTTEPKGLIENSMYPDEIVRMRRLNRIHAGRKRTMYVFSRRGSKAEKRQHGSENVEEAAEARTRARSTTEQEPETSIHDSANIEEISALSKTENTPDKRHHDSGKITEAEDVGTNVCSTTEHEAVNRPHGTENMKEVDEARMHAEKKPHDSTNIKEAEDDRTHVLSTAEHEAEKGHHDSKNIEEAEEVRTHERFTTEHGAEMRPQGSTKIEEAEEDRKHVRSTAKHKAETHVPSTTEPKTEKRPHDTKEVEEDRKHVRSTKEHEMEKRSHGTGNIRKAEENRSHVPSTTKHETGKKHCGSGNIKDKREGEKRYQGSAQFREADELIAHAHSTSKHEVTKIRKTFTVYCSPKDVSKIQVHIPLKKSYKAAERELYKVQDTPFWEITVDFNPVDIHTETEYFYKVLHTGLFTPASKSNSFKFRKHTTNRDSVDDNFPAECVAAHLLDIISERQATKSMKDRCMEIEQLRLASEEEVQKAIGYVAPKLIKSSSTETMHLFVVALGHLCKQCYGSPDSIKLSQELCDAVLDTLSPDTIKSLTFSAQSYVKDVCLILMKRSINAGSCVITMLNMYCEVLDLLDILRLLQHFVDHFKAVKILDYQVNQTRKLIENILKMSSGHQRGDVHCSIKLLVENLDFRLASKVYLKFQKDENSDFKLITKLIRESLYERIDKFLSFVNFKDGVSLIKYYWESIYRADDARETFRHPFENAVIKFLEDNTRTVEGCEKDIKDLAVNFKLFQNQESQLKLLMALSAVKNKEISKLFIELLEFIASADMWSKLGEKVFSDWYYSQSQNYSKELTLEAVCSRLSLIVSLPHFDESQELIESVNQIVTQELMKLKPQKIVEEIKTIDKVTTELPLLGQLVIAHVSDKLKVRSEHISVLRVFVDEKTQKMTLTTRLQAEIVCMVIDRYALSQEDVLDIGTFVSITKNADIWKMIFHATGGSEHVKRMQSHQMYQRARECIHHTFSKMKKGEVGYNFLKNIKHEEKSILSLEANENDIEEVLSKWTCEYENESTKISRVLEVLKAVDMKSLILPGNFSSLVDIVTTMKKDIESGQVVIKQCKEMWLRLHNIEENCEHLVKVILSDAFWNIYRLWNEQLSSKEETTANKTALSGSDEPSQYTACVGEHNETHTLSETGREEYLCSITYVQQLEEVGLKKYKATLNSLREGTLSITDVRRIFGNEANIEKEENISNIILETPVPQSVWSAVKQVYSVSDVYENVGVMKECLKALGVELQTTETLNLAFTSFNKLMAESSDDCTFADVRTGMSTIFTLVHKLSSETIRIMSSIAKSSSLICFLKDTIHEDLRNLIDAVEDISEQYVQESTVSGLIEAQGYLKLILTTDYAGRCYKFFLALEQQTAEFKNAVNLPEKIDDCMNNVHNLKSLYNNVANRGEQTQEVVRSIIDNGKFKYKFVERSNTLVVEVWYSQAENNSAVNSENTNQNTTAKKDRSSLSDLRSRALLLKNTERAESVGRRLSRSELDLFIKYVDKCFNLSDILLSLHCSGHVKYIKIDKVFPPSGLEENIRILEKISSSWEGYLKKKRKAIYPLNFVHGANLHLLYKYLEQLDKSDVSSRKDIEASVETFLPFIHPEMKKEKIQASYDKQKKLHVTFDDEIMLSCIGTALDETFKECSKDLVKSKKLSNETTDQVRGDRIPSKITDIVQDGKPLVAQLEDGSAYTVKTVIALYKRTENQSLPKSHQVLFCSRETTEDELRLLIERCLGEKKFCEIQSLFCIANVEMLPSVLQFTLRDILKKKRAKSKSFLLAIVCRGFKNHPIIEELSEFLTTITPTTDADVQKLFIRECPNVKTVTSDLPGQGKTTFINHTARVLKKAVKVLHISGSVRKIQLIERLRSLRVREYNLLHIDICDIDNPTELDTFLFELITLKFVSCDKVSANLNTSHVCLEIANSFRDKLRNNLQTAMLFTREHISWRNFENFAVSGEIQSAVQVVCHYLFYLKKGMLDEYDVMTSQSNTKPLQARQCRELLKDYFGNSQDMSFPNVITAVKVLSDQLKKMTCSPFFRINRLKDMIGNTAVHNTKSSLVNAMIKTTNEFASRAVNACKSQQMSSVSSNIETLSDIGNSEHALDSYKRVERMIKWENSNHLMFVFHNQNIQTITPIYSSSSKVPDHVKDLFERQMKRDLQDFREMSQRELQNILQKISRTDPKTLPPEKLIKMAKSYALTPDNLLKMVLIVLRIKANVPVVIMGETGCGKTSLLRYLSDICAIPFKVLNIHAGVSEDEIIQTVNKSNKKADMEGESWLFFDEINTSNSIGLISDIICHHRCLDKMLSPNLVAIGACNPYKLRSPKAISTAGLTGKVKTDEMSKLVYRVHPLPETVFDFVWDFGSLSQRDEKLYISRMVEDVFDKNSCYHEFFTNVLCESQSFVRRKESSPFAVSLRDIQRCKKLTGWFLKLLQDLKPTPKKPYTCHCQTEIRAIVLALAHCYHSRFSDRILRQEYRNVISRKHLDKEISGDVDKSDDYMKTIIKEEQIDLLSRMEITEGIAKNEALMENVFTILVCIFNKIPIFVVGKPGCSKSLAIQVIRSNIRGKDSRDDFFCKLPQLYCVSYQGSESSTSDGIIKVFQKAENYRKSNSAENVLSVVILDEIGLAEVSRFNPLKVLHSLLESERDSGPNIAVVGISNWALDASKMNRALHLSRTDMDTQELYETAKSISNSFSKTCDQSKSVQPRFLEDFEQAKRKKLLSEVDEDIVLQNLAKAYCIYINELHAPFKNFHGLRDFYALVKHIARTEHKNKVNVETCLSDIVIDGLERNFSGLPDGTEKLIQIFKDHFDFQTAPRNGILDIIAENVKDPIARHLMLITNGDSALDIVERHLISTGRKDKLVIFGSQFEDDLTDEYNYRILSKIILCMEEGWVLILKDLENIYGSLYDMLNQNYTIIGKKQNCRIALGAYSNPFCHVANSFRCIVLMDESKVSECDPPFLNRFEKHYLTFSDIVDEKQSNLIQQLNCWLYNVTTIPDKNFTFTDVLPIYSEDLVASLVWKLKGIQCQSAGFKECKGALMMLLNPAAVIRLRHAKHDEMRDRAEDIKDEYFRLPLHAGLNEFISNQMKSLKDSNDKNGLLSIIFTNSNVHTKLQKLVETDMIQIEKLGIYKSEKQLTQRIQNFWFTSKPTEILMIQCSAVDDENHILLTKTIIEECKADFVNKNPGKAKHVYLIIHLDKSKGTSKITSQINFVSEWNLVMLDNLECPKTSLKMLCEITPSDAIKRKENLKNCWTDELLWALTRIRYGPYGRNIQSIKDILKSMKKTDEFLQLLENAIWSNVSKLDTQEKDWQLNVACDIQALRNSATFIDALKQRIMRIIKVPLAKVVYCMEKQGILDSFFISTNTKNRRKSWKDVFEDSRFFSLDNIPDDTDQPECYVCNTDDLCLQMPFSMTIFCRVESERDWFLDELSKIKVRLNLEPEENLPVSVYKRLLKQTERLIASNIPDSAQFFYENSEEDYITDFCNILSMQMYPSMDRRKRTDYMKWVISQKSSFAFNYPLELLVSLHTSSWLNASLFRAEMQLFGICEKVLKKKDLSDIMSLKPTMKRLFEKQDGSDMAKDSVRNETQSENGGSDLSVNVDRTTRTSADTPVAFSEDEYKSQDKEEHDFDLLHSSEVCTHSPENILVQHICEKMLPTKNTLNAYGGLDVWQRKINTVLVLAAKVSNKSQQLHALRVCNDFARDIIILQEQKSEVLETIGTIGTLLANGHALDSEKVFQSIFSMVAEGFNTEKEHSDNNYYTVLSSYLMRCIDYNSATNVQEYLFEKIVSGTLLEDAVPFLKAPLSKLFDIEEEEFLNFLGIYLEQSEDEHSNESFDDIDERTNSGNETIESFDDVDERTKSENETVDSSLEHRLFVNQVSDVLKNLSQKKKEDSHLVLLFVDILQKLYERQLREHETSILCPGLLSTCHRILHEMTFGLEYIAAISFIKTFFNHTLRYDLHVADGTRDVWDMIAIVLKEGNDTFVNQNLVSAFLKSLLQSTTLCQSRALLNNQTDMYSFMKPDMWISDYSKFFFERSPLCLLISTKSHKGYSLCKEDVTESTFNVQGFMNISEQSEDGLLTMFSFAAREFYFSKLCEALTDNKRILAASIIEGYTKQKCKGTDIIRILMGQSDFKVSVFNINEKTSHMDYCITSFFVTLYLMLLAKNNFIDGKHRPFLVDCLVSPQTVTEFFLPGFLDTECETEELNNIIAHECTCGYRKAARPSNKSESNYTCLLCCQTTQLHHAALMLCPCGYRTVYVNKIFEKDMQCFICKKKSETQFTTFSSCICGFSTLYDPFTMSEDDRWCLFCLDNARSTDKKMPKSGHSQKKNICWALSDYEKCGYSFRGLHPVTVHILQMLVKGCLLGSIAFDFTDIKEIREIINMADARLLWKEIQHHWERISSHLNVNANKLTIILHSILQEAKPDICKGAPVFSECEIRRNFEEKINKLIISHIEQASDSVRKTVRKHEILHGVGNGSIETSLFEADDIEEYEKKKKVGRLLFRVTGYPTKENFMSEFYIQRTTFPFLNLVLRYETYFKLPRHIFNIVQWHLTTITRANYVVRKHDCLEMKVEDFIYNNRDQNHNQMRKRFENFETSWNELRKLLQPHKISQKMDVMHKQCKMKNCMIYGKESTLHEVLKILVVFQNDVINKALQMANSCHALGFLLRDDNVSAIPCVQITEAKVDDLINFSFDWNRSTDRGMIYRESNCTLKYGHGDKITYNFDRIEKAVAVLALAGKSYLLFENRLPNVIFTDELFVNYSSLKRQIKASIAQQPLPSDIDNGIRTRSKEDPRIVKELLAHLGIMMTLLKKTGKEEESRPLVDYASDWNEFLTREFPRHLLPHPESCVKLCHIVPLSELLEDICSETAVDALDKEFRDVLDENIQNHIIKVSKSKKIFRVLLKAIKLFSHRCLSSKMADPKQPLNTYLTDDSFWPEGSRYHGMVTVCNTEENLVTLLPDFIMVRHVYEVVKAMEIEIQNQESEDRHMQKLESRFSRKKTQEKPKRKQKKAAALVMDY